MAAILARRPEMIQNLARAIHTEMAYDSHSNLLARIKDLGLLPALDRASIAAKIADLTIEFVDSSVCRDNKLRSLLNDAEWQALEDRIQAEIIGNLDRVIESWRDDWIVDDKRGHMEGLKNSLEWFGRRSDFDDEEVIQKAIVRVESIISDLEDDEPVNDRHASPTAPVSPSTGHLATIFDDIDE